MQDELKQAQTTQLSLLPQSAPTGAGIDLVHKYVPMTRLGGDFFDYIPLGDGRLGILIADVTGHGVSASLIASMAAGFFRTFAPTAESIPDLFGQVHRSLYRHIEDDRFVTAFYCIYDPAGGELTYFGAGHPQAFALRVQEHEVIGLAERCPALGLIADAALTYEEARLALRPGDKVILYTDGLTEARNVEGQLFGEDRLRQYLTAHVDTPIRELLEGLYAEVLRFSNCREAEDDIALIGFSCGP